MDSYSNIRKPNSRQDSFSGKPPKDLKPRSTKKIDYRSPPSSPKTETLNKRNTPTGRKAYEIEKIYSIDKGGDGGTSHSGRSYSVNSSAHSTGNNTEKGVDKLFEKYRRGLNSSGSDLKIQTEEIKIDSPNKVDDFSAEDYRKLIEEKSREITKAKAQVLKIENDMVDKINSETKHSKKLLEDSQNKKSKLKKQIQDIKDRNNHLEKLSKITPNVESILNERNTLKSQVNDLTVALNRIQSKEITHKDIVNLQTQLADLETAQNNLLKENNALKEDLIQEQRRELSGVDKQIEIKQHANEVKKLHKELDQLTSLVCSVSKGEEGNLSFLLGVGYAGEGGLLSEEVEKLKSQVEELKGVITDFYKEMFQGKTIVF